MSNSPLVVYTKISPNKTVGRKNAIDRITPHCVVGQATVERLGEIFAPESKQASCNYGIGVDGRVGMYVEEKDRSWCSSSSANDNRAVTIECASDNTHPYAFKDVVYEKLIELCVDVCKRNGKNKIVWIPDKDEALAYKQAANEMLITVHRWFRSDKSCPGEWLFSRLGDLAAKVNTKLGSAVEETQKEEAKKEYKYYVQVGDAYSEFLNASNVANRLKNAGFDAKIVRGENINVTEVTEEEQKVETTNIELKEGDMVRVQKDAPVYDRDYKFSNWVYNSNMFVRSITGDRIVVSVVATGPITGAVHKKYLTKV